MTSLESAGARQTFVPGHTAHSIAAPTTGDDAHGHGAPRERLPRAPSARGRRALQPCTNKPDPLVCPRPRPRQEKRGATEGDTRAEFRGRTQGASCFPWSSLVLTGSATTEAQQENWRRRSASAHRAHGRWPRGRSCTERRVVGGPPNDENTRGHARRSGSASSMVS